MEEYQANDTYTDEDTSGRRSVLYSYNRLHNRMEKSTPYSTKNNANGGVILGFREDRAIWHEAWVNGSTTYDN
jgi:hypothetical protein